MKISRIVLPAVILILLSCHSDGPHTPGFIHSFVAGYVTNPDSTPAAGVQVDLMGDDWMVAPPFDVQTWEVILSTCTNEKGYFNFRFDYVSGRQYGVEIRQRYLVKLDPGENKYVYLAAESPIDSIAFGDCP